jgi:hypothetical protein
VDVEFLHEVGAVFFNGLEADTEMVCNLLVLVTFCTSFIISLSRWVRVSHADRIAVQSILLKYQQISKKMSEGAAEHESKIRIDLAQIED